MTDLPNVAILTGPGAADRRHIWQTLARLDREHGLFGYVIHGYSTKADIDVLDWAAVRGLKHSAFGAVDRTAPDLIVAFDGSNPDRAPGGPRIIDAGSMR